MLSEEDQERLLSIQEELDWISIRLKRMKRKSINELKKRTTSEIWRAWKEGRHAEAHALRAKLAGTSRGPRQKDHQQRQIHSVNKGMDGRYGTASREGRHESSEDKVGRRSKICEQTCAR